MLLDLSSFCIVLDIIPKTSILEIIASPVLELFGLDTLAA
jgi:hypothetical protein